MQSFVMVKKIVYEVHKVYKMLGNYRVPYQMVASRVVLSSLELVT
jgi:hypothetical protein